MFNWFKKRPLYQTTATDDMLLGDLPRHVPPGPIPLPNWHGVPKAKPWPAPPVHTSEADGYYDGYHSIGPTSSQSEYLKDWNQGLLDGAADKLHREQFKPKEPEMFKATNPVPPHPEMPNSLDNSPPFLIGMTLDGKTQFRLTEDYTTITMTMTQQGVIDLIEDLAHTIRKDYSVVIIPEDQEDTE